MILPFLATLMPPINSINTPVGIHSRAQNVVQNTSTCRNKSQERGTGIQRTTNLSDTKKGSSTFSIQDDTEPRHNKDGLVHPTQTERAIQKSPFVQLCHLSRQIEAHGLQDA